MYWMTVFGTILKENMQAWLVTKQEFSNILTNFVESMGPKGQND